MFQLVGTSTHDRDADESNILQIIYFVLLKDSKYIEKEYEGIRARFFLKVYLIKTMFFRIIWAFQLINS